MIFEIISGGGKTDLVGKEWAGLFFPRGKNGPAHSFPGEKTDWGEIPACYTGFYWTALYYLSKNNLPKKHIVTEAANLDLQIHETCFCISRPNHMCCGRSN